MHSERVKREVVIERLALAYSPRFQALLKAAEEQIAAGQGIPHDDFWREVDGADRAPATSEQ